MWDSVAKIPSALYSSPANAESREWSQTLELGQPAKLFMIFSIALERICLNIA